MTTIVSAARINHLRSIVAAAGQPPHEVSEGWSKSTIDPAAVVAAFDVLHVKPGYMLRAYQYRQDKNGNGIVWAMPAEAPFPEPDACPRLGDQFLQPPKPPTALDDYMDAIDGDRSPWSYLCASVLKRELQEFAAMWHGCSWSTHTILGNDPFVPEDKHASPLKEAVTKLEEWYWTEPLPSQWRPRVIQSNRKGTTVRFLTFTAFGQQKLGLHEDHYDARSYRCQSEERVLGTGPGGFVH